MRVSIAWGEGAPCTRRRPRPKPCAMPIPSLPRALPSLLRRLFLPALLLTTAPAALAQYPAGATVQSLPRPGDPAELLATALRTLAVEPNNLAALTAAGHNALVLGDPNAAVGFFGRAQEIAPRDGRVKAGLGSALVELEKPQDALRLFAEASRLGIPDDEIAEDRGLAYDLTGDPRKAQRDYAAVLAAHPENDIVRRRLALSQGISGDKAAAIATLDPLIRKRDIAGWRAQTFVLAMDGDTKGASDITHIMLPQQADMLQPFLVRLQSLSPADKARAVNFGEMPAAGRAYTPTELANTGSAPTYAASANAARVAPPRVAARPSDLAPLPSPGARPAITMAAPQVATSIPLRAATPQAGQSAPLAAVALTPAPERQVATQIVPTPTPTPTPTATPRPVLQPAPRAAAPAPAPVQIAQANPAPLPTIAPSVATPTPAPVQIAAASPPLAATTSGPPAPDLPTPAAAGHYDLPHDVARPSGHSAPTPAATVAAVKTIGTPVVHAPAAKSAPAVVATPEPKAIRLAAADDQPASPSTDAPTPKHAKAKPAASAGEDELPPARTTGKHATPSASTDDSEPVSKPRRGARGTKSASIDTTDDTATDARTRKTAHGKVASADDGEDQATTKDRRHAHGKSTATDDADTSTRSRKGGRGTKLAAADDGTGDADIKSRKGTHGRTASDDDAASSKSAKKESAKAAPERVFVQVAGGANKDDMDKAWAGLKKKAPDLMKGHTPQTTPVKATNRLLVGPFKSEDEAQAFVNKMAGKGLSGFTVKTGKGQKVEKVDSGQ